MKPSDVLSNEAPVLLPGHLGGDGVVDSRRAMGTAVFSAEDMGLTSTKRCPTTGGGMHTVFAAEAGYDVQRRVKVLPRKKE